MRYVPITCSNYLPVNYITVVSPVRTNWCFISDISTFLLVTSQTIFGQVFSFVSCLTLFEKQAVPKNLIVDRTSVSYQQLPGWWFGTFFIFPNSWDDDRIWLIFFRGVVSNQQLLFCGIAGIPQFGQTLLSVGQLSIVFAGQVLPLRHMGVSDIDFLYIIIYTVHIKKYAISNIIYNII